MINPEPAKENEGDYCKHYQTISDGRVFKCCHCGKELFAKTVHDSELEQLRRENEKFNALFKDCGLSPNDFNEMWQVVEAQREEIVNFRRRNAELGKQIEAIGDKVKYYADILGKKIAAASNLIEYATHDEGCNKPFNDKYPCKCGFESALKAWKELE